MVLLAESLKLRSYLVDKDSGSKVRLFRNLSLGRGVVRLIHWELRKTKTCDILDLVWEEFAGIQNASDKRAELLAYLEKLDKKPLDKLGVIVE